MKFLITGGSGKLGTALKKEFPDGLFPNHKELDITNPIKVNNYFEKNSPDIIIHTAAMTDVRKCETNKRKAWQTNVEGTKNLIQASIKQKSPPYFIYISTACVFDGESSFYDEGSFPNPKNFYGLTKLIGETIVENSGLKNWIVIRTNFVAKTSWRYKKAFTDRFGTFLFSNEVAHGIKEIINAKKIGIIHLTGDKNMSMYKLAKVLSPTIEPTTLKEYHGPSLTKDMSLGSKKWKKYTMDIT